MVFVKGIPVQPRSVDRNFSTWYNLLPLTTGTQREAFVEVCIQEGLFDHLQLTLDIAKGDLAPAEILRRVMGLEKKMPLTREAFAVWDEYVRRRPHLREELIDAPCREIRRSTLREILLDHLQHKFTAVPGEVIARIEATEDIDQLKAWLDRILDAPTIGDMGITPPTR
jgi:hypothetical protein